MVKDGKLLMVRRASRRGHGNWQVPGGFVEQDETIEQAVVREVLEEAGVEGEVQGVLGLRNRYDADNGNSLYVVLLLHPLRGEPKPDEHEVDRAEYFSLEEIKGLVQAPSINLEVAHRALAEDQRLLCAKPMLHNSGAMYNLFVG